jgi:hypothetical protein
VKFLTRFAKCSNCHSGIHWNRRCTAEYEWKGSFLLCQCKLSAASPVHYLFLAARIVLNSSCIPLGNYQVNFR